MLRYVIFVITLIPSIMIGQYSWQQAFPNLPTFSYPVDLVRPTDGSNRLFVVQQRGIIYVFNVQQNVSTRRVFLNITDRVSQSGSETGLLGMAFHPNYAQNGYFYINYTNTVGGQLKSFIARYQVSSDPDSALKNSELILLTVDQPYSNHNGGALAFGPDGYLYIGFGDGGSGNDPQNRAQNRTTLLGKILRIDVNTTSGQMNYGIPTTNPFYNNTAGYRQEIYAYGIRNPWKFSFDSVTGKLWCGDVGQDTREEIDIIENGGNYGWRLMEGFICTPVVNPSCQDTAGLLRPVWDYPNGSGAGSDGSITGGFVYRGSVNLVGKYIYGDYVSGRTWALSYDGINPPTNILLTDESYYISTFGVDRDNELYLCSYSTLGRIYKLNGPPVPVELSSFTANAHIDRIVLSWHTQSETNNFGFDIERRTAYGWERLGFVAGKGTTKEPQSYVWIDESLPAEYRGRIYYRLNQQDFDGTTTYSQEVFVDRNDPNDLTFDLYPSPAKNVLSVVLSLKHQGHIRIYLQDLFGRVIRTIYEPEFRPGRYVQQIPLYDLSSGLYFLKVEINGFTHIRRVAVLAN